MELTFNISDKIARDFLAHTPANQRETIVSDLFSQYLMLQNLRKNTLSMPVEKAEDEPMPFFGMWANRTLVDSEDGNDVDAFIRNLRKGRNFDTH